MDVKHVVDQAWRACGFGKNNRRKRQKSKHKSCRGITKDFRATCVSQLDIASRVTDEQVVLVDIVWVNVEREGQDHIPEGSVSRLHKG